MYTEIGTYDFNLLHLGEYHGFIIESLTAWNPVFYQHPEMDSTIWRLLYRIIYDDFVSTMYVQDAFKHCKRVMLDWRWYHVPTVVDTAFLGFYFFSYYLLVNWFLGNPVLF